MKKLLVLVFVFITSYTVKAQGNTSNTFSENADSPKEDIFAQAQYPDGFVLKPNTLFFPHKIKPYKFNYSIGVLFTRVPFDWVETALQAPLLNIHATFGLPKSFSLTGDFTTLLITNELRIGPRWNYESGNFSFNIGIDAEYAYGRLGFAGFDSWTNAWFLYPTLAIGYQIKDVALSLHVETSNFLYGYGLVGDIGEGSSKPAFNGGSIGFYSEQRYWKNRTCVIGLRALYTKYFFPAWAAYPTFDRYYFLPQILIGFKM